MEDEKKKLVSEIASLKTENAQTDRVIKQAKTFTSKKDEAHKKMKEKFDELDKEILELNKETTNLNWKLDAESREFKDKNTLKKLQSHVQALRSEKSMLDIDKNTCDARFKDFGEQKKLLEIQINEILTEKRERDRENQELENKRQGKGETEADHKHRQQEAEKEMEMRLLRQNDEMKANINILNIQLGDEEKKAKALLDEKITADQKFETETEDANKESDTRKKQRQEWIDKKLKLSMLERQKQMLIEEEKTLTVFNTEVIKDNEKLEKDNESLAKEISLLIQRIDVSTLLKQIDLEEMKMLSTQNTNMSMAFQGVLMQWENILKNDEKTK